MNDDLNTRENEPETGETLPEEPMGEEAPREPAAAPETPEIPEAPEAPEAPAASQEPTPEPTPEPAPLPNWEVGRAPYVPPQPFGPGTQFGQGGGSGWQPPYAQGQQGYPSQPPQYPPARPPYAPPYPGYPGYGVPQKKKMSRGLKAFIWTASILAAAALIAFGVYLAGMLTNRAGGFSNFGHGPQLPGAGEYSEAPDEDPDEDPDFDDELDLPDVEDELPDIDVTPNTQGILIEPKPSGREMLASEVYEEVVASTVTVVTLREDEGAEDGYAVTGTGTGIFATADGYIITNAHVVNNSKQTRVDVIAYDGNRYRATVVGVDRTSDLAVLKTADMNFTPAHFGDSDELIIGDQVIAIGNPGGERFSGSMTGGYISGLNREVGQYSANGMTFIQTDAAINPGNSGGPLVNMYGQVVGINSSKIVSSGYEGMGFAIPISQAKAIVDQLMAGGYVAGRTRLGITGTNVTEQISMMYGVPRGFAISEIDPISSFTGTEAEEGDIIIALDGQTVQSLDDISGLLSNYAPGDTVTVTLFRSGRGSGETLDVEVILLEDKGETTR